jgi:hypothetical protein
MATIQTFDDFNSSDNYILTNNKKQFQFREETDDEGTLLWLNNNFNAMSEASHSRIETYRRNMSLYKGLHYRNLVARPNRDQDIDNSGRKPKISVNFIKDMIEAKVAQRGKQKIAVAVIPSHDEPDDINDAKAGKMFLDARANDINLDDIHKKGDRIEFTFGSLFQAVLWDFNAGQEHPLSKELMAEGKKLPILGRDGKPTGKYYKGKIRVGDVVVKNYGPDRVFPELFKTEWDKVNHIDITDWIHIDELKAKFPKKANEIKENSREFYNYSTSDINMPPELIQVRTFYHKPTEFFEEGCIIEYTDDCILSWEPYLYDHGELPVVVGIDVEIYGELWGRSMVQDIEQLNMFYNNIQSSMGRDYAMASAPKWMVPKGSTKITNLNNDLTVVEYSGQVAPQLMKFNPTPEQAFTVQDRLEAKIAQQSVVYDISRGEVPKGVTANSALRFLDEQETQRDAIGMANRKLRVIKVYKQMLMVMAQFYDPTDGRTFASLGRKNEYLIQSFKKAVFKTSQNVVLQNTSALPDTKTGKISAIIDLNAATQKDPIFSKNEIIEMMDLGLEQGFKDQATYGVDNAKIVLDMMMNGEEVPEVQKFDDLLNEWLLFSRSVQAIWFKQRLASDIQLSITSRLQAIEMFMFEKCKLSPKFLTIVTNLDNFPMLYVGEMNMFELQQMTAMQTQPPQPQPTLNSDKMDLTTKMAEQAINTGE